MGVSIAAVVLVGLVVVTLAIGINIVPQGHVYTVERFGKYHRSLESGLGLIAPYVERIGRRVNVMEQVIDVPSQEAFTRDNAGVRIDAVVFYQVLDAARASYEVSKLEVAVMTLTMTNIRTVVGSMDLDQLPSHRDEINERLLRVMDAAASPWGVKMTRIEIKDIVPPADLAGAMARQMKAEREKRASVLEAEGHRQADILRAEGRKQSAILEAEGRKEAAFRDAEARERSAAAEAKATELVSNAIADGDVNAINYFVAQKYVEAFGKLADSPQQKTVIIPADMASLVGTIAGVGELVKTAAAAQQQQQAPPPAPRPRLTRPGSAVPPTET